MEANKPSDKRIQGWSFKEYKQLLLSLHSFGSRDISNIAETIPTKTAEQIRKAIDYFREREAAERKVRVAETKTTQGSVPYKNWAKFLQDNFKPEELHTDTAAAVRNIAQFEDIPPASRTQGIDFRKVYHAIADALEGKPIQDDDGVAAVLNECVADTARTGRTFMKAGALQNALQHIDVTDKSSSVLPRPSDDVDLATMRALASQKAYNPLNIPEQYLKRT